jgi:predicted permease
MRQQDMLGSGFRTSLYVLLGAVGLVLLIACANVANLLLVQAIARDRETAIRAALGATGWRLTRQFLAETVLLAAAGGVAGIFVAWWGADLIIALRPPSLNQLSGVTLDRYVLAFTFGLTLLTAILFGLPAAARARTLDLTSRLKGSSGGQGRDRRLMRSALVSAQLALAVVLLVSAGLLVRTLLAYQQVDVGFAPERLMSAEIIMPEYRFATPESQTAFGEQLLERVGAVPGVEAVALGSGVPPRTGIMFASFGVEGRPETEEAGPGMIAGTSVSGEYFATVGLRLREGRGITHEDVRTDANVFVINHAAAQRYFPGASAVGKRLRLSKNGQWGSIVGVVDDVPALGLTTLDQPVQLYMPSSLVREGRVSLIVRTSGDPESLVPVLRNVVHALDASVPLRAVESVEQQLANTLATPRFNMALLLAFAATALLLTVIGLYGVVSYTVSQRTKEIGIRMALGARPESVRRMILLYGMRMTVVGLVIGAVAALAAGRALAGMLHGVSARDPGTFAIVALVLTVVSVLACYLPARRATAIDPLQAIRTE